MNEERKIEVEEVESVAAPPRARVPENVAAASDAGCNRDVEKCPHVSAASARVETHKTHHTIAAAR